MNYYNCILLLCAESASTKGRFNKSIKHLIEKELVNYKTEIAHYDL